MIDLFIFNTNWMVFLGLVFFLILPVTFMKWRWRFNNTDMCIVHMIRPRHTEAHHISLFSRKFRLLDCHNLEYCSLSKISIKCQLTVGLSELFPNYGRFLLTASLQIWLYALTISLGIWMIMKKYFTNITHIHTTMWSLPFIPVFMRLAPVFSSLAFVWKNADKLFKFMVLGICVNETTQNAGKIGETMHKFFGHMPNNLIFVFIEQLCILGQRFYLCPMKSA